MTAAETRLLSARIERILKHAIPEYLISSKGGSFDSGMAILRIEVAEPDSAKRRWEAECSVVGLTPDHHGMTVTMRSGDAYRLTEIKLGRPKFLLVGVRLSDGKAYKLALTPDVRAQLPGASAV